MDIKVKRGATRVVVLSGNYALKFPSLYSWRHFLAGLLANIQEYEFSTLKDDRMCPVVFRIWGGWLSVMPRCEKLTQDDFDKLNYKVYRPEHHTEGKCKVPVENKFDSFGWYNGKIVAIDYGS